MQPIRRILFPTDFSEHADSAWLYALQFAQQFGADVHLLHVVSPPPHMGEAYLGNFDSRKYVQALTSAANDSMDRQIEAAKDRALIFRREARVGVAFREIIEYAAKHDIDLIVMGTHGHTGLAHVVLGSVAEKVVRTAPCPVLTVRCPAMQGGPT